MPSKENRFVRVSLQLTERQYDRLMREAERLQKSPSEVARTWGDYILDLLDGVPTVPLVPPRPPANP